MVVIKWRKLAVLSFAILASTWVYFQFISQQQLAIASNTKLIGYGTRYFGGKWDLTANQAVKNCNVSCIITDDYRRADAVIFHAYDMNVMTVWAWHKPARQIWVMSSAEAPSRIMWYPSWVDGKFNLTWTYQKDSDIIFSYGNYVSLSAEEKDASRHRATSVSAGVKTKLAVYISSHCGSVPSSRMDYIRTLQQYMSVDLLGSCSQDGRPCPEEKCGMSAIGSSYKFYLAYENSLCKDYISEKFWVNALTYGVVPVVFGGLSRRDYDEVAPPHSFVYALDFVDSRRLAEYLLYLDGNDTAYQKYFSWKKDYKVDLSRRFSLPGYCELCHKLHRRDWHKVYHDMASFWSDSKSCVWPKPWSDFHILERLILYVKYLVDDI